MSANLAKRGRMPDGYTSGIQPAPFSFGLWFFVLPPTDARTFRIRSCTVTPRGITDIARGPSNDNVTISKAHLPNPACSVTLVHILDPSPMKAATLPNSHSGELYTEKSRQIRKLLV